MPDPDDLYGLPLDEFTAARNALAKELAKQGDKSAAAEVKKLPKPNRTAWALNQLARRQPDEIETLLTVGEQLREAQQRALSGDASQLRAATRAEQEQINRLVDAALAIAPGVQPDPLRATLRAAAGDPSTGDLLRRGRLVSDVETAGFGLDGLPDSFVIETPPPARKKEKAPEIDKEAAAREEQERQARKEVRKEAERLRKEAELAVRRAQRLRQVAEEAAERARQARREADAAAEVAEEAQRRAEEAAGRLTPDL